MDAGPLPFGELFRERKYLRSDLRLLEKAIRAGWPIPEETRAYLVNKADELLKTGTARERSVRETLRACWVVMAMVDDNVRTGLAALRAGRNGDGDV